MNDENILIDERIDFEPLERHAMVLISPAALARLREIEAIAKDIVDDTIACVHPTYDRIGYEFSPELLTKLRAAIGEPDKYGTPPSPFQS